MLKFENSSIPTLPPVNAKSSNLRTDPKLSPENATTLTKARFPVKVTGRETRIYDARSVIGKYPPPIYDPASKNSKKS